MILTPPENQLQAKIVHYRVDVKLLCKQTQSNGVFSFRPFMQSTINNNFPNIRNSCSRLLYAPNYTAITNYMMSANKNYYPKFRSTVLQLLVFPRQTVVQHYEKMFKHSTITMCRDN